MKLVQLLQAVVLVSLWGGVPVHAAPQHQSATDVVTITSSHAITLQWSASTSSVVGYFTYRSTTSGGPYTKITPSVNALFYVERPGVNGAVSGTKYYYVVTSNDGTNESIFSNEASGTMP